MKRAWRIFLAVTGVAGLGAFCLFFFPWPLWPFFWALLALVGLSQVVAPVRGDSEHRPPAGKGDFSDFDDKIKWDKFR
ncbi:MAG: hypothetical protein AB1921_17305 [Thermodesulfobacteriota bacterium]